MLSLARRLASNFDLFGQDSDLTDSPTGLFVGLFHPPTVSAKSSAPTVAKTRISVMSYNVFFHPRQGQDRAARRRAMLEAFADFETIAEERLPDVVAFQEVDDDFRKDEALAKLFPYRTERVGMNMIASQYPILEVRHLPDQTFSMYVKIDLGRNRRLNLLNVHLEPGTEPGVREMRLSQYATLRDWIPTLGIPRDEPVVVAGDFNDETEDAPEMVEWSLRYDPAKTGTFVGGKYFPGSWSARANWLVALHLFTVYPEIPKGYTKTIDYVMYDRRHLAPVAAEEMRVLPWKSPKPWPYRCEGPMPWCAKKGMSTLRGTWEKAIWYEGGKKEKLYTGTMEKPNDLYDDFSDHFPVLQHYTFML